MILSSDFIGLKSDVISFVSASCEIIEQGVAFSGFVPSTVLRVFWMSCLFLGGFSGGVDLIWQMSSFVQSPLYVLEAFRFSFFT